MQYKYWVAVFFVLALFMEFMDSTIVNVAMPTFANEFNASTAQIQWVSTAYLLAIALFVLVSGWAGDRFGTKRVFLTAVGLFTIGSALCGLAQSLEALIFYRALQGIGGGMMSPVGSSMIMRAFPVEERAKASGLVMVPTMLAPVVAPFIGGYLVQYHGWPWIFWINLPLAVATLVAAWCVLRNDTQPSSGRLDIEGFFTSGVALCCLFYALAAIGEGGESGPHVAAIALVGVMALAWFLLRQGQVPAPLVDLRVFADRLFCTGSWLQFTLLAGLSGSLFAFTLCEQDALARSPLATGGLTVLQAAGIMLLMPIAGRYSQRWGAQRTVLFGIVLYGAMTVCLLCPQVLDSPLYLAPVLVLRGAGLGMCLVLSWSAAFTHIAPAHMGRATATMSAMIQLGGACGIAAAAAALSHLQPVGTPPAVINYQWVLAGFALLAVGCVALGCWHSAPKGASIAEDAPPTGHAALL